MTACKKSFLHIVLLLCTMCFGISYMAEAQNFVLVIDAGHGGHDPGAIGKKAKEKERQKAEVEKKKAIEEARTAAKAEADAKYKEQITQAKQDKEAALSKAKEIASKLDKNADRELVTASLYFSEAQTQFEKFLTAANKITDEKGAKIKKVAADFLKQYIDKLL